MESIFAVFNSDAVSRDGTRFSLTILEDVLWQTTPAGVPSNFGHDSHRPAGWAQPTGLYFQPGMVRSTGLLLMPESAEEEQLIRERHARAWAQRQQQSAAPYLEDLRGELRGHLTDVAQFLTCEALAGLEPNLTTRVFPELGANLDKAGLVYLSDLLKTFTYKSHGVFQHKKRPLLVFAHPYFRRSLSRANNFHWAFLDELLQQAANPNILVRIRLDGDMVGYAPSFLEPLEYEYWHGPKFNDDIASIPDGLTRHTAEDYEHRFYGIQRTEFIWQTGEEPGPLKDQPPRTTHTFELEEVQDVELPANGAEDTYGCRYVHSIYDRQAETFEHFDGAIRLYDLELMAERVDTDMDKAGHRSLYTKLFRIDDKGRLLNKQTGPGLALRNWKSLIANYMQGNPLIAEYFQAEEEEEPMDSEESAESAADEAANAQNLVVPYSMQPGDGIRLQVAYQAEHALVGPDRQLIGYSVFTRDGERQSVVEYDVIELRKALQRLGTDLFIPANLVPLCSEDGYLNIPTIFHGGPDAEATLATTVQALRNLVGALYYQQRDKVCAFTLSWNEAERQVSISILGHVTDLQAWLGQAGHPPVGRAEFVRWLEWQKSYLNGLPRTRADYPLVEKVVKSDGVLYLKRQPMHQLSPAEAAAVQARNLTLGATWQPGMVRCNTCGADYWQCPHSTVLDADVGTTVIGAELVGRFWTDRPA